MTIKQAIKVLKRANKWRRGGKGEQPDPKEFGEAIYGIIYWAMDAITED